MRTRRSRDRKPTLSSDNSNDDAAIVRTLVNAVLAEPEIRQPRVRALRRAIVRGAYARSDRQIACAILADFRDRA